MPARSATSVPELVDDDRGVTELATVLAGAERYALDTEFHRERTYWPRLALLQVAWVEASGAVRVALVDPLAADPAGLSVVLKGPGTMVAHAAEQDLEVLQRACGAVPSHLFDTQIAAGFVGHASASLAGLVRSYLGVDLPKGDRLTDWSERPLRASQRSYAAADVAHLIELTDRIGAELDARGRAPWAEQECELLRSRPHGGSDPTRAWWRLRDARALRGAARGIAQEVAAWRELRARRVDLPVRHVLPDLALQAIAHRPPRSPQDLAAVRGLDSRFLRNGVADELLGAIAAGRALPESRLVLPPSDDVPKPLRPAVALAMAWVAQLGRDEGIDPALLATRVDVVGFLADPPRGRLNAGWRARLVGVPLRALLDGDAALAFDGRGGLVVEARSRRPLQLAEWAASSEAVPTGTVPDAPA